MKYFVLVNKAPEYFSNELFHDVKVSEFDGIKNFKKFTLLPKKNVDSSLPREIPLHSNFDSSLLADRLIISNNYSWLLLQKEFFDLISENSYLEAVPAIITNVDEKEGKCPSYFALQLEPMSEIVDLKETSVELSSVIPGIFNSIKNIKFKKNEIKRDIFLFKEKMSVLVINENLKEKLENLENGYLNFIPADVYDSNLLYQ